MLTESQHYRSAGRLRSWAPVLVVLLAIPVMVFAVQLLPNVKSNAVGAAAWGIMIGVGLLATVAAFLVSSRLARAARRRLAEALQSQGFTAVLEPTEEQRAAVMEGMQPLALFEAPGIVHWHAWKKIDGEVLPAIVMQHSYFTGGGRNTREHFRTLVAWPVKQVKPEMWLRRTKVGITKVQATPEVPDVIVGDATFDAAFLIQSPGDATAPRRLLTPAIRQFILAGPKREAWTLARGYACCIFHADVAADGLLTMLRRARTMAEMWEKS